MRNYLKVQMFDGKGGYENVVVEKDFNTGLTRAWRNYGYGLCEGVADILGENLGTRASVMTLTVKKSEGKRILKDLFVEYKNLIIGENNL